MFVKSAIKHNVFPAYKGDDGVFEVAFKENGGFFATLPAELVTSICRFLDVPSLVKLGLCGKAIAQYADPFLKPERVQFYRFSHYLKQVQEVSSDLQLASLGLVKAPSNFFRHWIYGPSGRVYVTDFRGMSGLCIFHSNKNPVAQFFRLEREETSIIEQYKGCIPLGDRGFIIYYWRSVHLYTFEEGQATFLLRVDTPKNKKGSPLFIRGGRRKDVDSLIFTTSQGASLEFCLKKNQFKDSSAALALKSSVLKTRYVSNIPTFYVRGSGQRHAYMCTKDGKLKKLEGSVKKNCRHGLANEKWTVSFKSALRGYVYERDSTSLHLQWNLSLSLSLQVRCVNYRVQLVGDYLLVVFKMMDAEMESSDFPRGHQTALRIIHLPTKQTLLNTRLGDDQLSNVHIETAFLIQREKTVRLGLITKEAERSYAFQELQVNKSSQKKLSQLTGEESPLSAKVLVVSNNSRWKAGAKVFLVSAVVVAVIGTGVFSGLYFGGLSPLAAYCVLGGSLGVGFVQLVVSGVCYKRHRALQQNVLITENSVFE